MRVFNDDSLRVALALVQDSVKAHHVVAQVLGDKGSPRDKADWVLLSLLLRNAQEGRFTTVVEAQESMDLSLATVRGRFGILEKAGYVVAEQKVGRTVLYNPAPLLMERLSQASKRLGESPSLSVAQAL